jgi:O-antigen/teichoic acid export membrane protein
VKKFLTGSFVFSFAGNIITSITGFIGIWALARILTPEDLGRWLVYITAFTFGDMMRSGIIHTALIKYSTTTYKQRVIGSSWLIGITLSVLLMLLVWLIEAGIYIYTSKYFEAELSFYLQLLFLFSFPFTFSIWLQQMEERFNRIMYLRLFSSVPLLIFILSGFYFPLRLENLIQIHIIAYLTSSLLAIAFGWSHIRSILSADIITIKKLLSFGRYTMGTLISTNLLKSTDTFMITWYLGPAALAAYNLPYKLIELIEIPLRSLAATFLPQAVKQSHTGNFSALKNLFYHYTTLLTILLLPVTVLLFLFAEEMVVLIGGQTYGSSANIFRCFVIYSLFLPLDRFLGITLDIINKPHLNLLKVCLMVIINITGNLVAVHLAGALLYIAVATILTVASGVIIGWLTLRSALCIRLNELFLNGYLTLGQRINRQPKSNAV